MGRYGLIFDALLLYLYDIVFNRLSNGALHSVNMRTFKISSSMINIDNNYQFKWVYISIGVLFIYVFFVIK